MSVARPMPASDYAELKRSLKQQGLLDPQPAYYAFNVVLTVGLQAISLCLLVLFKRSWLQLLNAVFLAFGTTQMAFLGHDIGHRQVCRHRRPSEVGLLATWNLIVGLSGGWWIDKHRRHHAHVNEIELDPDIGIPAFAFSEEAARSKRGHQRLLVKHQAHLLPLLQLLLGYPTLLAWSIDSVVRGKAKYQRAEAALLGVHYVLYFGLLFSCLEVGQGLVFFAVHRTFFGLYFGSVNAPNHKGMPVWEGEKRVDFLRQQILSSRNVRAHPITDFWYGGLNYQIEHHLFPSVPRNRLREVQRIVKAFCQHRGIPYHETGFVQSYREIFRYLHEISAALHT